MHPSVCSMRSWRLLVAQVFRARVLLAALLLIAGSQVLAADEYPPPVGGESSVPRGSSVGVYFGFLMASDRAAIGIDGGGSEYLDTIMRASPDYEEWLEEEVFGGTFAFTGEPTDYTLGPQFTFGLTVGYAFRPHWDSQVDIASYRGEATATVPMEVETDEGTESLSGSLRTQVRGLVVDGLVRRSWKTGLYSPEVGAGIRLHRMSPEDTRFSVKSVSFNVDRQGPRTDVSPLVELGVARALGDKLKIGLATEIAGRSLPQEDGGESWVIEPEIRLWLRFKLAPDR